MLLQALLFLRLQVLSNIIPCLVIFIKLVEEFIEGEEIILYWMQSKQILRS